MSEKWLTAGVSILIGIIGVAVLATLVSNASNTTQVIQAGSGGFACILKTALTGTDACKGGLTEFVSSRVQFPT